LQNKQNKNNKRGRIVILLDDGNYIHVVVTNVILTCATLNVRPMYRSFYSL